MTITSLFGVRGYRCPYVQLGSLLGHLGFSTSSSPSPRKHDRLRRPYQVWPHIPPWGNFFPFSTASILDYMTGEYPDDYGWNISGLVSHPTAFANYESHSS